MGKKKLKNEDGGDRKGKQRQDYSDDDEMLSHMSSEALTIASSPADSGSDDEQEPSVPQAVLSAMDNLTEKRTSTRQGALSTLSSYFSTNYAPLALSGHIETVLSAILKSIKRDEQEALLACDVLSSIFINIVSSPMEEELDRDIVEACQKTLMDVIKSCSVETIRAKCIETCSVVTFTCMLDDSPSLVDMMDYIQSSILSNKQSQASSLTSALDGYALLASGASLSCFHSERIQGILKCCMPLLESHTDMQVKIACGELIALLNELTDNLTEVDEETRDTLLVQLEDLSTGMILNKILIIESSRYKSKKDNSIQRSSFKQIYSSVAEMEAPCEKLNFGSERLEFDSWGKLKESILILVKLTQLKMVRQFVGSGMTTHFEFNPFIQSLFDYEPPVREMGVKVSGKRKTSRVVDKARSKAMAQARGRKTAMH